MSSTMRACAVPPPSYLRNAEEGAPRSYSVMSKKAWELNNLDDDGRKVIKYGFLKTLGYSDNRRDAVRYTIDNEFERQVETWEDYANVKFSYQNPPGEDCDVRIAFLPGSSWSAVGECAKDIKPGKPTLNLGWLKDQAIPDEADQGTILHEFGHVLGLMHEHQSPARGQFIHLKELEVYRYYEPLLGSRALVKSQIIDTYNEGKIMNMSTFDMESIMMYFMPAHLNEEGIDVPVNTKLSKLDKAFVMLNYPPDIPLNLDRLANLGRDFMRAMFDAGVTNKAAGEILEGYLNPEPGNDDPTLAARLKKAREKFTEYNERTNNLRSANAALLNSIDTGSLTQFGIFDFLGSVVKNKLFQSILKNVVGNVFTQLGNKSQQSIPGASPSEVANMIGGLVVRPELAEYIRALKRQSEDGDEQHAISL